jgi:hypothetical protein
MGVMAWFKERQAVRDKLKFANPKAYWDYCAEGDKSNAIWLSKFYEMIAIFVFSFFLWLIFFVVFVTSKFYG